MIKERLNHKRTRIIVIPVIALVIGLAGNNWQRDSVKDLFLEIAMSLLYVSCYWELNRLFFIYILKKLPGTKNSKQRIIFQLGFMTGFVLLAGTLLDVVNYTIPGITSHISFLINYSKTVEKSLVCLGMITLIFEFTYFVRLYENSRFENQKLKEEALTAQLNLLKQQISPHFLFNNLNALITLIPNNPELSVQFLQKLSAVYRQVLNDNYKDLVSLESELDFLEDYIFLYQIRFGQKLQVGYKLRQDVPGLKVIPLALQMLVENAIKHNIISSENKLFIEISSGGNYVTVVNNMQKKTSGVLSSNTGLKNIQNRYKLLTDKPVKIVETKDQFSVSIPILN
jgi:two-component system LytT family sensor kinase